VGLTKPCLGVMGLTEPCLGVRMWDLLNPALE
jgi:hypothetical protein